MPDIKLHQSEISNEFSLDSVCQIDSTSGSTLYSSMGRGRNKIIYALMVGLATQSPFNADVKISLEKNSENLETLEDYQKNLIYQQDYLDLINSISIGRNKSKYEIYEEIISYCSLESNWDGYGAISLEVKSTTNAIRFIDRIGENIAGIVSEIFPNPHGTVSLIWRNNSQEEFSIEIGNESMSYYFILNSSEPIFNNNVPITDSNIDIIADILKTL